MSDPYYDTSPIDFGYYWRVLKSALIASYLRVGLFAFLVVALTYLFTLSLTPEYRATSVLHVAPQQSAVFDLREILLARRDPAFQQTQVGIIQSRATIEQVVIKHKLHETAAVLASSSSTSIGAFLFGKKEDAKLTQEQSDELNIRRVAEDLRSRIEVSPRKSSYLIDVTTQLSDPNLAAQISNSLAEIYIDQTYTSQREAANRNEEWLIERLETVRSDLQAAERVLQTFKESANIIGSSNQNSGLANQEIERLSSRLIEAREARLELEVINQQILSIEEANGDLQSTNIVEDNALIQTIRNELLQLEQRKSELSGRYGPEHRRMIELDAEVSAANDNLQQQTTRVITSLKAEYDLAVENESFIRQTLEQSTGKVQNFGRNQFQLLDLEQNVLTQREIYTAFLENLNKSRATGETQNTNVRLTDPAIPPLRPESSKGLKIIVFMALFSIATGFGIAIIKELFDNTLVTQGDVAKKTGLTSLGLIPKITDLEADDDGDGRNIAHQYFAENKHSPFAEAIRTLRSSIMLSSLGKDKLRIMFTSTQPSEGKTSLAISTASAFGQIKKTLLIDGDLRRPSVLGAVSEEQRSRSLGLSDLCIGVATEDECIQHVDKFGIDVLTSGTLAPNPQELFCSASFSLLLNRLSEKYDVIVIDSPPSGGLSDSHLLASQVDDVVYVVKAGSTPVNRIRLTIQSLLQINAPIKGVVLNQADTSISGYEYGYYGAYGSEMRTDA